MVLERWFHHLEKKLWLESSGSRQVLPFDWGLNFLKDGSGRPIFEGDIAGDSGAAAALATYADNAMADSDAFFTYARPAAFEFRFEGAALSFPSPLASPYHENNTVYCRYFPADSEGRAAIVLPQWNADGQSHVALCRLLNRFGISALRLTLPYHERRRPAGCQRADYMVSANIGRTLDALRQSVLDVRAAADWLVARGYRRLAVVGTSVGSCIAFLTFGHDDRFSAGVFIHVSSYFADAVWTGLTTEHVRRALEDKVSLDELRRFWLPISPLPFVKRLIGKPKRSLLISARYDLSFLPRLSRDFFNEFRQQRVEFKLLLMPCGHYTLSKFPLNYIAGLGTAIFLKKALWG